MTTPKLHTSDEVVYFWCEIASGAVLQEYQTQIGVADVSMPCKSDGTKTDTDADVEADANADTEISRGDSEHSFALPFDWDFAVLVCVVILRACIQLAAEPEVRHLAHPLFAD